MDYQIFGCKTNKYFTEKWLAHPYLSGKNGLFLASCVVTDRAKSKWVRAAKKYLNSGDTTGRLYLSGCGNLKNGIVDPHFYEIYPELIPYQDRIEILPEDPSDMVPSQEEKQTTLKKRIRSITPLLGKNLFTRKHIVIQTGCDNFCTFCLTVQARGRHKWRGIDEILSEVQAFISEGGKEIVLTGTNLGAWGSQSSNDFQSSRLTELLDSLLTETTIDRIRISSLGVEFCSNALLEYFTHPRINPYIHLSIQSGSGKMLQKMNRHYSDVEVRQVLRQIQTLKRVDGQEIQIGADLIVGFPDESREDFRETISIVETGPISQVHAFPFSAHLDHYSIPAGSWGGQVSEQEKQSRLGELIAMGEKMKKDFLKRQSGKTLSMLIEKTNGSMFQGLTANYIRATEESFAPEFPGSNIHRGDIVTGIYRYHENQMQNPIPEIL